MLFVAVAGLTMGTVSAKTYTKTINFKKEGTMNYVKLGHGDYCAVHYGYVYKTYKQFSVRIFKYSNPLDGDPYHNQIKIKVYFKNNNGKTVINTYKKKGIQKKLPSGYKPIKAVVYYSKQ